MPARRIRVRGQVQGVGFRPFVWQLANRLGIKGQVLNDPQGVLILATGDALEAFETALRTDAPSLAEVTGVESEPHEFSTPPVGFTILQSAGKGAETRVTPDAATCDACATEIRDAADRRHGYAFANCTHCGPRFTILRGLPYDRAQTSMAAFPMCPACASEYANPADRRFHAQPVACPNCGPRLWLEDGGGETAPDAIEAAVARLAQGQILAIKGLGGFHLACNALDPAALTLLRHRKRRPAKPFAVMGTLNMIRQYAAPSKAEAKLLRDPAAPIVLLNKSGIALPEEVAPGQSTLGWMLPYTPMHHLLMDAFGGPLVMTSGNLSGEPQVIGNKEAREKLGDFADAFVMHDRDIERRLDDSVERVTPHGPMVLRRARGRVPGTLPLPPGFEDTPQVVAYGGQMKSAICLLKNNEALLSHHLGDLDDALTSEEFLKADTDYAALFDHQPALAACDLHPDFRASRHAASKGLPLVQVQHHHAHMAACLGENGWPLDGGKVAGIVLDGLGLGPDGTVWGGEVLLGDYLGVERAAWLKPVPLIGGDMAQKEPWRNLLAQLDAAGMGDLADQLFPDKPLAMMRQAAAAGLNAPLSSSAGRLFDAIAAALGFDGALSFEGEAAMWLEAQSLRNLSHPGFGFGIHDGVIDPAPLFRQLFDELDAGKEPGLLAAWFHASLARAFADQALGLVNNGTAQAVVLSGGCFQNALLLDLTVNMLGDVPVMIHQKTPANDGGLALGQALVAAAQALSQSESK
ncbi:carbamoyltransferase HypF [Actibacterium lipolyticum]|uniref:Carbamoyltransferase HypF n=1 Tax=Actibacterium lipolyticum TaxID=1524263 RepID=A0A238JLL5_9RHOB|nr:carbamoyltransferase HypF [Actibacterium lipolyticum]SMX30686.1 Carbamoyltransferase HypF [Actibacterium lipolyticum]